MIKQDNTESYYLSKTIRMNSSKHTNSLVSSFSYDQVCYNTEAIKLSFIKHMH